MRNRLLLVAGIVVLAIVGVLGVRSCLDSARRREARDRFVAEALEAAKSEEGLSKAAVALRRAIEIDPEHVPVRLAMGDVCLRLNRPDEALEHLRAAEALAEGEEQARARLQIGRAAFERYRGSGSEDDFRASRNAFLGARGEPSVEPEALEGYGCLFLETGPHRDLERARETFEELLRLHPQWEHAARVREVVDALTKQPDRAGG